MENETEKKVSLNHVVTPSTSIHEMLKNNMQNIALREGSWLARKKEYNYNLCLKEYNYNLCLK